MNVRRGDVAVVIDGFMPNIGRLVYVADFLPSFRFWSMGLGTMDGWRVRVLNDRDLVTTRGPRMAGVCPDAYLRRIDLSPQRRRKIEIEMAKADFREAMQDLVRCFEEERGEKVERQEERDGLRLAVLDVSALCDRCSSR